jgi:hypothetical protein
MIYIYVKYGLCLTDGYTQTRDKNNAILNLKGI